MNEIILRYKNADVTMNVKTYIFRHGDKARSKVNRIEKAHTIK